MIGVQYDAEARWLSYALPTGTPPAGGWPIYLSLITDLFDGKYLLFILSYVL